MRSSPKCEHFCSSDTVDPCVQYRDSDESSVTILHTWKPGSSESCICHIESKKQYFTYRGIVTGNITLHARVDNGDLQPVIFPSTSGLTTDFIEIIFSAHPGDRTTTETSQLIIEAEEPLRLTCSTLSVPPRPTGRTETTRTLSVLPRLTGTTETAQALSVPPRLTGTTETAQTLSIPQGPTGTTETTHTEGNTADDNTIWIIVGAVGIGVVVIGASVAIAIVVYIRIKRGRNYERPLPRRQMEITMYTGLVPESLRERNLATVRNPDTASHIYSEVDEHRMRNMQVDGPSQPNLQQVSSQNQSEISRHQASGPMDDIETDDDGYLRPFARSQV
ncbi:hypothetical protein BaRGS_00038552 [Batillaria attramentaria]|uniref:Uncharacterized protein n=1 Tax=Batillaria attramentaria TaxID=370345 RepID=A0ABD0J5H6_9CAEN